MEKNIDMQGNINCVGYKADTKYIPYKLLMDFKDTVDITPYLANRVSFSLEATDKSSLSESYISLYLGENYISKLVDIKGKWTIKILESELLSNHSAVLWNIRAELMFSDKDDFNQLVSNVLLLDKLSV